MNKMPKAFQSFDLPFQMDELPKTEGGIYFFRIRFPSDYDLGIKTGLSRQEILNNLARRLDKYAIAYAQNSLRGDLDDGKAMHMRLRMHIQGDLELCTKPSDLLRILIANTDPEFPIAEITQVIRFVFSTSPPIYIGICFDQPFFERIKQHIDGRTGLLPFLKSCQMGIVDVSVHCLSLDIHDRTQLRLYEKIGQSIFRPSFSLA